MMSKKKKTCFFIAPIGKEHSASREWSDKILNYIVAPAVTALGYQKPERADAISAPGFITAQIIKRIVESDLVIADLTEHNPNVFYELAIRHTIQKPVVHLLKEDAEIPFDLKNVRIIWLSTDVEKSKIAIKQLKEQIKAAEKEPVDYTSLSDFAKLKNVLLESRISDSEKQNLFELLTDFHSSIRVLEGQIANIDNKMNDVRGDVRAIHWASMPSPFIERRLSKLESVKYKAQQKGYLNVVPKDS